MSYKNDSEIVILGRYSKSASDAKAELFETYDQLRDLTVSGPTLGGSGFGKPASFLMQIARLFSSSAFMPVLGNQSINIPGTSYFTPSTGGTGITPGGQASFGLGPMSAFSGFPSGGAAMLGAMGGLGVMGALGGFQGSSIDDFGDPLPGGMAVGGASGLAIGQALGAAAGTATGVGSANSQGMGFGRNYVMPMAGLMSGIGGLLTTLGPYFGPFGLAGAAAGTILSGTSGAILSAYQNVSSRILNNADVILTNKVSNIETVVKMLEAQQDVLKKLLKESMDGDKKALDNL